MVRSRYEKNNKTINFEENIIVRVKSEDKKAINKILKLDDDDRYADQSHFVRCAIRKLVREDNQRLRI